MRTKTYALLFNILLVLLVLLQLNVIYGDGNNDISANNVTNITITKYHTKSTKAADLPQVQLQDVLVAAEKNKLTAGVETNTRAINSTAGVEKIRRRKITPTDNQEPTKTVNQTVVESAKPKENKTNESLPQTAVIVNGTSATPSAEHQHKNMTFVAQNVALNLTNAMITKGTLETNNTAPIQKLNSTQQSLTASKAIENGKENTTLTPTTSVIVGSTNSTAPTNKTSITTTTSTTTITTTTTSTTTTTTTPKPKKPLITYSVEDFPDLDANILKQSTKNRQGTSKLPTSDTDTEHEAPHAQPSQEHVSAFPYHNNRDYIVPIVAIMFAVPITMGIVITAYRRFRDFWSTRHYRRMDFLVDGMYND